MSIYTNRATMSLLNMTNEMMRKNIEISRITKTCTLLLMSGLSADDIDTKILERCLKTQQADGGFIGNTDTIWNIKLLSYFPKYETEKTAAITWLKLNNGDEPGFGRSKRDIHRIPVTGTALYLLPELADENNLEWLENIWLTEKDSLTYKAAYTLLAFIKCKYKPKHLRLIEDAANWLCSQQQKSGGFAPWFDHPVGENVYCTAVAMLALMDVNFKKYEKVITAAYKYLCGLQLKSGIWPYHEIEDGTSWGMFALSQCDVYLGDT